MFSDSINENIEVLGELLRALPPSERPRAKTAYVKVGRSIEALMREYPKDQGAIIGAALGIFTVAQKLVEQGKESGETTGLIQLLS